MDEREMRQHLNAIYDYVTKGFDEREKAADERHAEVLQGLDRINKTVEKYMRELVDAVRANGR